MGDTFRALYAEQVEGKPRVTLTTLEDRALPPGEVTLDVAFSSLNYKDGLALTGKGKVLRKFPLVPGIDVAGTVRASTAPRFKVGEAVFATGWNMGESLWGGYTQRTRLSADILQHLPRGLNLEQVMAVGTAGFTAMLSVQALEDAGSLRSGREVVVTGAAGGVGSMAVALLSGLGQRVVASTGRREHEPWLRSLGASDILDRAVLAEKGPPLASERWGAGVDSVGGQTLATVLSQTVYEGAIAACGVASGPDLPVTVFPFILRGVKLLGVNSVLVPMDRRERAWQRLVELLPKEKLAGCTSVVPMSKLLELAPEILGGKTRGRVVVDVNA
ncbi:MAG TPA: MDR family oxidoreductase [Myxococcaceae bacterium]|nr:MDR family oxidoreductase [Myxococcaceae bacterium]